MVSYQECGNGASLFLIRPNGSLGWVGMKWLFALLACGVTGVAAYFASLGAWLVLPFTGLELLVLGAGIYLSARWSAARELIEIGDRDLRISRGRSRPTDVQELPRHWTRVSLRQDPRGWYPSRLLLVCHGRAYEVGRTLVEQERLQLAADLGNKLSFGLDPAAFQAGNLPEGLDTASDNICNQRGL